jgi:hypothetical protein
MGACRAVQVRAAAQVEGIDAFEAEVLKVRD